MEHALQPIKVEMVDEYEEDGELSSKTFHLRKGKFVKKNFKNYNDKK